VAKKFYAVAKGFNPGIYDRWEGGAKEQVNGCPGARFRGFAYEDEAQNWYRSQVDPDYKAPWELVDLDGYAIVVMLQPHARGQGGVQLLGTNIYDEETEDLAQKAALEEFWKPEHDEIGKPLVEIHFRPERQVEQVQQNHLSRDYESEPGL
jgi:hypothetical protein